IGDSRRLRNGHRAAGLCRENPRRLPATQSMPQKGVPIVQTRETVHPFGDKVMGYISCGRASLTFDIVEILNASAAIGAIVGTAVAALRGQSFAPGIVNTSAEIARVTLAQGGLPRTVRALLRSIYVI